MSFIPKGHENWLPEAPILVGEIEMVEFFAKECSYSGTLMHYDHSNYPSCQAQLRVIPKNCHSKFLSFTPKGQENWLPVAPILASEIQFLLKSVAIVGH